MHLSWRLAASSKLAMVLLLLRTVVHFRKAGPGWSVQYAQSHYAASCLQLRLASSPAPAASSLCRPTVLVCSVRHSSTHQERRNAVPFRVLARVWSWHLHRRTILVHEVLLCCPSGTLSYLLLFATAPTERRRLLAKNLSIGNFQSVWFISGSFP